MTFPNKPYDKWDKVGKLVFVPISYERSDEDEMKGIPIIILIIITIL